MKKQKTYFELKENLENAQKIYNDAYGELNQFLNKRQNKRCFTCVLTFEEMNILIKNSSF